MDKIEKIRKEIERLKGQLIRGACAAQIEMETNCKDEAYNEVLAFIDTLSEEPDKSLEEAADSAAIKAFPENKSYSTVVDRVVDYSAIDRKNYRDGFIAGAELQKEQDEKEQADLLTIVALDAAQRAKEQIREKAVEGEIVDSGFNDGTAILKAIVPDRGYDSGDKVKLIVIKED